MQRLLILGALIVGWLFLFPHFFFAWAVVDTSQIDYSPNITYITHADGPYKLDICRPKGLRTRRPIIMLTHGGGFRTGSKADLLQECVNFALDGYIGVTVDYTLTTIAPYPAQIDDVQYATRWIRSKKDDPTIDPNHTFDPARMGSLGGSAGGYLATVLGVSDIWDQNLGLQQYAGKVQVVIDRSGDPMDANDPGVSPDPAYPKYVQIGNDVIAAYTAGYTDTPQFRAEISPVTYATSDDAPLLAVHSTNDHLAPIKNSIDIVNALTNKGVHAVLHPFAGDGTAHGRSASWDAILWPIELDFIHTYLPITQNTPTPTPRLSPTVTPRMSPTVTPRPSVTSAPVPGDADGDGRVDGVDYVIWLTNYGKSRSGPANGDFNSNGIVDGVDYTIWLTHYTG